ncbi:neuropeptide receptor 15 [Trichonephila inaurata madagascariensis]|uniref:Neuropeptide receptor 15 n=1 Tax=Trichonephila inaurata madagascariensis TaxID=2747483 RepID=A0A8X7CRT4_9ARAC|nr:neuropeptide receptor 15 [Trichonephila inaurata madagascariensis]
MNEEVIIDMNISDAFYDWNVSTEEAERLPPATAFSIISLSLLFFIVGAIGISGNLLVIFAILGDQRMRNSVTNLLIMNLALSDLIIMIACIPDIIQFIENKGWRLGLPLCKALRFTEVFALYASVMTLVSVCLERYIAIMHPIKAHIMCCRTRILLVISIIWPSAMICASPNLFYHVIIPIDKEFTPCVIQFPNITDFIIFKYCEFFLFYLLPLILQVILYIHIGKRLFSNEALKRIEPTVGKENFAGAMKARRGVIKMLIAGVTVYFLSFSPHQILLIYNTFSSTLFKETWSFLIFVNIMAYASSACNPLLYSIFSQKFRQKFQTLLACCRKKQCTPSPSAIYLGCRSKTFLNKSVKTTVTEI